MNGPDPTPLDDPNVVTDVGLTDAAPAPARRSKRAYVAAVAALAIGTGAFAALAARDGDEPKPIPLALRDAVGAAGTSEAQDRATPAADGGADLMYPMVEYRYVLGGALDDLGGEAPVYRLVAPSIDTDDVARIAAALGIDAAPVAFEGGWEASDPDRTLQISGDSSGWYVSVWNGPSYRSSEPDEGGGTSAGSSGSAGSGEDPATGVDDTVKPDEQPVEPVPEPLPEPVPTPTAPPIEPPTDLPDDATAIAIATDIMRAVGALDGADWEFEVADGTMMDVAVACEPDAGECSADSGGTPIIMSRSVIAHRSVDGDRVAGLDWYFDIGDHDVVQSAGGMLAGIEPVADYPLRTTADVFADLQNGDAGYYGGPVALADDMVDSAAAAEDCPADTKCAGPDIACVEECPEPEIVEVTISGVELGAQLWYAADSAGNPVQYVVPTYHFVGSLPDGTEWSIDLLAIADEYVTPADSSGGADGAHGSVIEPGEPGVDVPAETRPSETGAADPGAAE